MNSRTFCAIAMAALLSGTILAADQTADHANPPGSGAPPAAVLNLDQCLQMAMQKNHRRPASRFEIALAEAQHRQALAAYWPQVNLKAAFQKLDEPLNFIFPATAMQIPSQSIGVPGGSATVTIPANAFGPGFPPAAIQMPISFPGQQVNTPAQTFPVPQQDVKALDSTLATGEAEMKWLLFDGGMRKGLREQSGGYVEMMRQQATRTDLEIGDQVRRMYWGAVLARQLHQIGKDTLARMEVTLNLTENLYKNGSGKVTKADYLENQMTVESLRAMVASLEKNESMAQAALANTAGLAWNAAIQPADGEIPFAPYTGNLDELVGTSYQFSPDWKHLEAAIRSAEGAVTTARSGYYPQLAITGELHRWWNNGYSGGLSTPQNRAGWSVGVGLQFPLFDGFLTHNKIGEALARLNQIKEKQFLLREGIGLQVKDIFMGLTAAAKSTEATGAAMRAAVQNRELNERAYQNELVDTEKVVRAQLMEALMSAQHLKARFDHRTLLSELTLVVGTEVQKALSGGAQ